MLLRIFPQRAFNYFGRCIACGIEKPTSNAHIPVNGTSHKTAFSFLYKLARNVVDRVQSK